MSFITVRSDYNGEEYRIPVSNIEYWSPTERGGTRIYASGKAFSVREKPDQVDKMYDAAKRKIAEVKS